MEIKVIFFENVVVVKVSAAYNLYSEAKRVR
jgi:hypothetical protein